MNELLADVFALYLKTKNFHWHMSGPHFRDYHLMLDEQSRPDLRHDRSHRRARAQDRRHDAALDRQIAKLQRIKDNDAEFVDPLDMLAELRDDNKDLVARLRSVHDVAEEHNDVATTSLIEVWIDETERRLWFLFETSRREITGH